MNAEFQIENPNDEISFSELISLFWHNKILILVVTCVFLLISFIYLQFTKPLYEVKAYLIPPGLDSIAALNIGRTYAENSELKAYEIKDVYQFFINTLMSESLKNAFFKEHYLLFFNKKPDSGLTNKEAIYRTYLKNMVVKIDAKSNPQKVTVSFYADNAIMSRTFAEEFIALTRKRASTLLVDSIKAQNKIKADNIKNKIDRLYELARQHRLDRLALLTEAMATAKAAKIHNVAMNTPFNNASDLYLVGTKALASEIKILNDKKIEYPFLNKLRKLQSEYNFYSQLQIPLESVALFQLDGEIISSNSPLAIRKGLILFLGLIGGLATGFTLVFLTIIFRGNKKIRL